MSKFYYAKFLYEYEDSVGTCKEIMTTYSWENEEYNSFKERILNGKDKNILQIQFGQLEIVHHTRDIETIENKK